MKKSIVLLALAGLVLALAPAAQAEFVAYHDFGSHSGTPSTGNITTHQTTTDGDQSRTNVVDFTVKDLIRYSDGVDTGVDFSIANAIGMDNRDGKVTPPDAGTDADALFNVAGLNLSTGTIVQGGNEGTGTMTITLTGLDPNELYDVAFYGNRALDGDGLEQFILGGADSATNSSSDGVIDPLTTNVETRNPAGIAGNVIRWSDIDPGTDGTITVTMDPNILDLTPELPNVAYLNAMRLEEQVPAPIVDIDGGDRVTWFTDDSISVPITSVVSDDVEPGPAALSFKWYIDEVEVAGATADSIDLTEADLAKPLPGATNVYVVKLEAFDGANTGVDSVTITVYADACEAAKGEAPKYTLTAARERGDTNYDCIVDLVDFAALALNWLENVSE